VALCPRYLLGRELGEKFSLQLLGAVTSSMGAGWVLLDDHGQGKGRLALPGLGTQHGQPGQGIQHVRGGIAFDGDLQVTLQENLELFIRAMAGQ
jgi:hypothetical protein